MTQDMALSDYPEVEDLGTRIFIARAPVRCDVCGERIEACRLYERLRARVDGELTTTRRHFARCL